MSIYAISDLHLSFNTNKPMDIFGWENYEERIKKNWLEKVNEKRFSIVTRRLFLGNEIRKYI